MAAENCKYIHVDYGAPVVPEIRDLRTSNDIYGKFIPTIDEAYYSLKERRTIPEKKHLIHSSEIPEKRFETTYSVKHDWKSTQFSKPTLAHADRCTDLNFMRNVKEKMFQTPPCLKPYGLTEVKSQYTGKNYEYVPDKPFDFRRTYHCDVSNVGKGALLRLPVEGRGYAKYLDIYATTNKLTYPPYNHEQRVSAATHLPTIHSTKPSDLSPMHKEPVFDSRTLKTIVKDRVLPKKISVVPNRGMQSEYQNHYIDPTGGSRFVSCIFDTGVEFPDSLSDASGYQTLVAPNMYCTQNSHIGSGIHVRSSVDLSAPEKIYIKKYC